MKARSFFQYYYTDQFCLKISTHTFRGGSCGGVSVEEFLWPRVQRDESCQKSSASVANSEPGSVAPIAGAASPSTSVPTSAARRPSTRSRSSANIGDTNKRENALEKTSGSSKGKGKAVLKPAQEEGIGPQTRNTTRRRAVLGKDAEVKPFNGESSSEDEELDISPVEIDDALVIEDDDLSIDEDDDHDDEDVLIHDIQQKVLKPVCMTEKGHDVKLGDSVEGNTVHDATTDKESTPAWGSISKAAASQGSDYAVLRSSAAFGTRGAMSFAAAAMAGIGSTNGRGLRGRDRQGRPLSGGPSEPPKLLFTVGGKQLSRHLTIYQAIQRQLVLDEGDEDRFAGNNFVSGEGSRFWSDIYTITYQKAEDQSDKGSSGGSSKIATVKAPKSVPSPSNSDVQQQRMSLLDSILQGELPCDLEKSNPTYNILALLRVLEGLNQLAPRLRSQIIIDNFAEGKISNLDELSETGARVPAEDFINSKLTPKLSRQIQDALALCSGSLPSWCFQLTKACPFLFPFETRRQYFCSSAFGLSRALYRLQQQQGADGHASATDREVRVGRLQRQKVRVSRNRILDSAAKVMEMYSSQKAVLEVEYFGEVGTGLGPTLEFYTLLSHDLQKSNLKMWRSGSSVDLSAMDVDLNDQNKKIRNADSTVEDEEIALSSKPVCFLIRRLGKKSVFDISTLQIFTPRELDYLLCGQCEVWQAESLAEHIKFDHGYTAKSPAIINLLEIMGEFTPEQQRAFCQFVTGAPRLPPGGLAVLNPKLTIVRKHSSTATSVPTNGVGPLESADDDLPSVMTCANYLKLPPYSSKEIMYKKLMYAINEGQGSFDLS
ncbi:hypothetical protein MLD38_013900 [Melastoma candidum]|uniref:Uncharacterized protein n=1 Tax=Melastoma candidum TaxID=119954 RepID=A0ACB9RB24_9MYRT|nr:hypothetical protein MLD38_013900 [Melastoma candidum]